MFGMIPLQPTRGCPLVRRKGMKGEPGDESVRQNPESESVENIRPPAPAGIQQAHLQSFLDARNQRQGSLAPLCITLQTQYKLAQNQQGVWSRVGFINSCLLLWSKNKTLLPITISGGLLVILHTLGWYRTNKYCGWAGVGCAESHRT